MGRSKNIITDENATSGFKINSPTRILPVNQLRVLFIVHLMALHAVGGIGVGGEAG